MEIIVTVGATLLCTIGVLRLGAGKNNKIDIV